MTIRQVDPIDSLCKDYDLVIATLGYEQRSRYVCETRAPTSPHRRCCGFPDSQVLSFAENKGWFEGAGYEVDIKTDDEYFGWVCECLDRLRRDDVLSPRILFDISSVTRVRIATFLDAIVQNSDDLACEVDFAYSLAAFTPAPTEASVISTAGPVLDRFSGYAVDPELPVSVIIGAGYEPDRIVGVLEYLEPGLVWVWRPTGRDARFLEALDKANEGLWETIPQEHVVEYDILSPYQTFVRLESLCYGLTGHTRPTIVPFGPKVFALISLLVALHWPNELSVWRVSGEQGDTPVDRKAEGTVIALRAEFGDTMPSAASSSGVSCEPDYV